MSALQIDHRSCKSTTETGAPFIHSFIVDEWETTNPAHPAP
jgi:hypothetical protein